ncbi:MAG: hypothetical protein HY558_00775 [Euryarchaeota archaeon]|nr:hypothetical protein [Euryarchaeota archaeon]
MKFSVAAFAILALAALTAAQTYDLAPPFEKTQTEEWTLDTEGNARAHVVVWTSEPGVRWIRSDPQTRSTAYVRQLVEQSIHDTFDTSFSRVEDLQVQIQAGPTYTYDITFGVRGFAQPGQGYHRALYNWEAPRGGSFYYSRVDVAFAYPPGTAVLGKAVALNSLDRLAIEDGKLRWSMAGMRPGFRSGLGFDYGPPETVPPAPEDLEAALRATVERRGTGGGWSPERLAVVAGGLLVLLVIALFIASVLLGASRPRGPVVIVRSRPRSTYWSTGGGGFGGSYHSGGGGWGGGGGWSGGGGGGGGIGGGRV